MQFADVVTAQEHSVIVDFLGASLEKAADILTFLETDFLDDRARDEDSHARPRRGR